MPAFNHDDPLVRTEDLPSPNFASVLLVDLEVYDAPVQDQRRAVVEWLSTHEPSPSLRQSLEEAGLWPAARIEGLTPREREVLDRLAQGESRTEMAARLHISVRTVDGHLGAVLRKLGVRSRGDLMSIARQYAVPTPATDEG